MKKFILRIGNWNKTIYLEDVKEIIPIEEEKRIPKHGDPYTWQRCRVIFIDGTSAEGERTF